MLQAALGSMRVELEVRKAATNQADEELHVY
jgi:hypothetical protein